MFSSCIGGWQTSTKADISKLRDSTKFVSDEVKANKDATNARIATLEENNRSLTLRLDGFLMRSMATVIDSTR